MTDSDYPAPLDAHAQFLADNPAPSFSPHWPGTKGREEIERETEQWLNQVQQFQGRLNGI